MTEITTTTTTVAIRELITGVEHVSRHLTTDPEDAVRRAVTRGWGRRARLVVDHELDLPDARDWTRYGQVGVTLTQQDGSVVINHVTGRVRVTVT